MHTHGQIFSAWEQETTKKSIKTMTYMDGSLHPKTNSSNNVHQIVFLSINKSVHQTLQHIKNMFSLRFIRTNKTNLAISSNPTFFKLETVTSFKPNGLYVMNTTLIPRANNLL